MTIRMLKETSDLRLGTIGPVLVAVWFREATVASFEVLLAELQTLAKEHGKVTYVPIALSVPNMPTKEVNDWMKQKGDFGGAVRGTVITILARGLSAVLARSVIATVSLFTKEKYTVVKSLAEAAQAARELEGQPKWVSELAGLEADLETFVALPRPGAAL
jgi:hypothetical protein